MTLVSTTAASEIARSPGSLLIAPQCTDLAHLGKLGHDYHGWTSFSQLFFFSCSSEWHCFGYIIWEMLAYWLMKYSNIILISLDSFQTMYTSMCGSIWLLYFFIYFFIFYLFIFSCTLIKGIQFYRYLYFISSFYSHCLYFYEFVHNQTQRALF